MTKFSGSQLRASSYKVKLSKCYAVPPSVIVSQSARSFSALARLYYAARPSITAMLRRLYLQPQYLQSHLPPCRQSLPPCRLTRSNSLCPRVTTLPLMPPLAYPLYLFLPRTRVPTPGQTLRSCPISFPETPGPRPQRQLRPPSYLNGHVGF